MRRLSEAFPLDTIRAFADDTAMVIRDWWGSAEGIMELFQQFGTISGKDAEACW